MGFGYYKRRVELNERIITAMRAVANSDDPRRSVADVARSIGAPRTRVQCAMADLARAGELVPDGFLPTSTRPAPAFRLVDRRPSWLGCDAIPPRSARAAAALDRYFSWVVAGRPLPLPDDERAVMWIIESALKSQQMSGSHAIALMHVHCGAVWAFGRLDMRVVYTEALDLIERRLDPVFEAQR